MFVYVLGFSEVFLDVKDLSSVLLNLLQETTIVKQRMAVGFDLFIPLFKHVLNEKFTITDLADVSSVVILRERELPDLVHTFGAVGDGAEVAILKVLLSLVIGLATVALPRLLCLYRIIDIS